MGIESELFDGISEIILPPGPDTVIGFGGITSVLASAAVTFSITVPSVPAGIEVGQTVTFSNDFTVNGPNINANALQGIVTTVTAVSATVITLDHNVSFNGISVNYPATAGSITFAGVEVTIAEVIAPDGAILFSV